MQSELEMSTCHETRDRITISCFVHTFFATHVSPVWDLAIWISNQVDSVKKNTEHQYTIDALA